MPGDNPDHKTSTTAWTPIPNVRRPMVGKKQSAILGPLIAREVPSAELESLFEESLPCTRSSNLAHSGQSDPRIIDVYVNLVGRDLQEAHRKYSPISRVLGKK